MNDAQAPSKNAVMIILVAALGYFVDVFDLILFSVVRVSSLQDLGLSGDALLDSGVLLLNMQMIGMLLGGIAWGIWGDKRGRVSVLFGSILLYSAANIANGLVTTVEGYAFWRFLAGIGLAGELGAGITLVSEVMHRDFRGYGTTIVASVGVMGAIVAALVGSEFYWRTAYYIGGGLGLLLLLLRVSVYESGMFQSVAASPVSRGNILMLFTSRERAIRFLACILSGLPIWYVVGILITFSPEIGSALGMAPLPSAGSAVMYAYIGLVLGDISSGLLSQLLRSRRKVLLLFLVLVTVSVTAYLFNYNSSLSRFYLMCALVGFAVGYWAVFVTTAAEQFGTNLRATVATTVPNFVRGAVVPITLLFRELVEPLGILNSALVVGGFTILSAFLAVALLSESFHKDLNYVEKW